MSAVQPHLSAGQPPVVAAVSVSARHRFSKDPVLGVELVPGLGVLGDCHAGATVQHLSRLRRDPTSPNLRQVHLIGTELYDELNEHGFGVTPGQLGENVTTTGVDLLGLDTGARLRLGDSAVIEVTGLRNPCRQLERFRPGLLAEVLARHSDGSVLRRAGVMGVVVEAGVVRPGDPVGLSTAPVGVPARPLRPV